MRSVGVSKRLAMVGAVVLLMSTLVLAKPGKEKGCEPTFRSDKKCQQVPEGGSSGTYLLLLGGVCSAAFFVRSRLANSSN